MEGGRLQPKLWESLTGLEERKQLLVWWLQHVQEGHKVSLSQGGVGKSLRSQSVSVGGITSSD